MSAAISTDIPAYGVPLLEAGNGHLPPDVTVKLVVKAPTADTPGYLRRQRRAFALNREFRGLKAQLAAHPAGEAVDDSLFARLENSNNQIIEFVLDYVVEPADRALATDALLDLSETTLLALLSDLQQGASSRPLATSSAPASSTTSSAG